MDVQIELHVDAHDGNVKEPDSLLCPITRVVFRDPVFVAESGTTYERSAILTSWKTSRHSKKDPLTNQVLSNTNIYTNWDKRREVQAFLDLHSTYIPQGWDSREVPSTTPQEPKEVPGTTATSETSESTSLEESEARLEESEIAVSSCDPEQKKRWRLFVIMAGVFLIAVIVMSVFSGLGSSRRYKQQHTTSDDSNRPQT
jgi:hypothetical protein